MQNKYQLLVVENKKNQLLSLLDYFTVYIKRVRLLR